MKKNFKKLAAAGLVAVMGVSLLMRRQQRRRRISKLRRKDRIDIRYLG